MATGSVPVRWLLETRKVWRFCKLEMQFGRLPMSLLPLKARVTSCGTEHKAVGKVPPIHVPSTTTARNARLGLLLDPVVLDFAC